MASENKHDEPELTPEEIEYMSPDANENAVESLLSQAASEDDWKYTVLRQWGESSRDTEYAFEAMPSDFPSLSALQLYLSQNWGGGKYRLMCYYRGKLKKNIGIRIAESKIKTDALEKNESRGDIKIAQILERMVQSAEVQRKEDMAALRAEISQLRQAPAAPPIDPLAMLEKISSIISNMGGQRNANPMRELDSIMSIQDRLEDRARKRALESLGQGEEDKPWYERIIDMAPTVLESLGRARLPAPVPGADSGNGAASLHANGAQSPAPGAVPPSGNGNLNDPALQQALIWLDAQAARDLDPEPYAMLTLAQFPDRAQLKQLLSDPDIFSKLTVINPALNNHKDWWATFILDMRVQLGLAQYPEDESLSGEEPVTDESSAVN